MQENGLNRLKDRDRKDFLDSKVTWTYVKDGEIRRRLSPQELTPKLEAPKMNLYVYQRILNPKEACGGKIVNFLDQQERVCCADHDIPLVKTLKGQQICSRQDCYSNGRWVCPGRDGMGEPCCIGLCMKHFKQLPDGEQKVSWQSHAPRSNDKRYQVLAAVPDDDDSEEGDELQELEEDPNLLDDVVPDAAARQEADKLMDFTTRLLAALDDERGLMCETAPDAEDALYAQFADPTRMYGQYLFNW